MTAFCKISPCNNCPYRKDAPLQHWSKEEFINLLNTEKDFFGAVFGCHKKDGSVCVGWLMNQDKRGFPSLALRVSLTKNNVTKEYLENLKCKSPMYDSVEEMCYANFPELKKIIK